MSLVFGNKVHGGNTGVTSIAVTLTYASGSVIIADICANGGPVVSVVSTALGTFTKHVAVNYFGETTERWYLVTGSAHVSDTITVTATNSNQLVADVYEWKGVNTSSPFDAGGPVTANAATQPIDNGTQNIITTVSTNTVVIVLFREANVFTPTAGSGFTQISGTDYQLAEYKLMPSPGALTCTQGSLNASGMILDALVEASSSITGILNVIQDTQTLSSAGTVATETPVTLRDGTTGVIGGRAVSGLIQTDNTLTAAGSVFVSVTGALNITEALDTLASIGTVTVGCTLSVTEALDTLSAVGKVDVRGILSANQASETLVASGGPVAAGILGATQAVETLSAAGNITISGNLSTTQASQTLVAIGFNQTVTGNLNSPQAVQTLASIGKITVGGALSVNQSPQTLVATGSSSIFGSLNANQTSETLSSFGSVLTGSGGGLNVIQASQTLVAAGLLTGTIGSINVSQAPEVLVATAGPIVNGILNTNQVPETLVAAGGPVAGSALSVNQASETLVASGSIITPSISGTLNINQVSQILIASGKVAIDSVLGVDQVSQVLVAAGFVGTDVSSELNVTQATQILSATGVLDVLHPNVLKYNSILKIEDFIHITDWQPIADGVAQDIGIVLRVQRGDVALSYTPTYDDDPDDFNYGVYLSGEIYTTSKNQIIWIKPADPDFPISANGEILYNVW